MMSKSLYPLLCKNSCLYSSHLIKGSQISCLCFNFTFLFKIRYSSFVVSLFTSFRTFSSRETSKIDAKWKVEFLFIKFIKYRDPVVFLRFFGDLLPTNSVDFNIGVSFKFFRSTADIHLSAFLEYQAFFILWSVFELFFETGFLAFCCLLAASITVLTLLIPLVYHSLGPILLNFFIAIQIEALSMSSNLSMLTDRLLLFRGVSIKFIKSIYLFGILLLCPKRDPSFLFWCRSTTLLFLLEKFKKHLNIFLNADVTLKKFIDGA